MKKLLAVAASMAVVGALAAAAWGAYVESAGPSRLTQYDAQQLDLNLLPLPASAPAARVVSQDATKIAGAALAISTAPAEVIHAMASEDASSPPQTVWIVLYDGAGRAVLGGPPGEGTGVHAIVYEGVMIDDQTGSVMRTFSVAAP